MEVTAKIIRGNTYVFKLRARNIWGWGVYSEEKEIKAATRPLQPTDVTASIVESGNFRIEWVKADNQGDELLSTVVEIQKADDLSWVAQPTLDPDTLNFEIAMAELEQTYLYV